MHTRSKVVVGSVVGAVAIHLAMLACTGSTPLVANTTGHDGGLFDGGLFDAAADVVQAVRDAVTTVVDGEVNDAVASDDGGASDGAAVSDAGTPSCMCAPQAAVGTFSLTYDTGSGPTSPPGAYSRANVGASVSPAAVVPGHGSGPIYSVNGSAIFYLADGTEFDIQCSTAVDSSLAPAPWEVFQIGCYSNAGSGLMNVAANVAVTTLTDTEIVMTVDTVTLPERPANGSPTGTPARAVTFRNVVFRQTSPAAHYATIPNAYEIAIGWSATRGGRQSTMTFHALRQIAHG